MVVFIGLPAHLIRRANIRLPYKDDHCHKGDHRTEEAYDFLVAHLATIPANIAATPSPATQGSANTISTKCRNMCTCTGNGSLAASPARSIILAIPMRPNG